MYYKYGISFYKVLSSMDFIEVTNSLNEHTVAHGIDERMVKMITHEGKMSTQSAFMKNYEIALKDVNRYISPKENVKYFEKGNSYFKVIDDTTVDELFYSENVKGKIHHITSPQKVEEVRKANTSSKTKYEHFLSRLSAIDWKTF